MPEVEIIRRGLAERLLGKRILQTEVLLPRLVKWPDAEAFRAMAAGRTVEAVARKGKYLLLGLDSGDQIVVHLRMTGRLWYVAQSAPRDPYARVVFHLEGGDFLVYADLRTLGTLYGLKSAELWRIAGLAAMGPEPLSPQFTAAYLKEKLAGHRGKIKAFLLDQKKIGGIGNIYADEALHLAGVHPARPGGALSAAEIEGLHAAVNRVIADGIADGGTTFRDYRDGLGKEGAHQEHLFVYARRGLPCKRCGAAIEKTVVAGRGTHFCPVCQRWEGKGCM